MSVLCVLIFAVFPVINCSDYPKTKVLESKPCEDALGTGTLSDLQLFLNDPCF